ncbi:MAG TPA: hypothetical protein PLP01_00515 [Phycisphaerae bacterium]|nr:hypothetical protein [Phycisphaerae bacterium]
MKRMCVVVLACIVAVVAATAVRNAVVAQDRPATGGVMGKSGDDKSPYAKWKNGPSTKADFFPIAVWCQAPRNAPKFRAIGINVYLGIHGGPEEKDLEELKKQGMPVICDLNEVGMKHRNDPIIIGWMHGDEPDNAQSMKDRWKNDADAANKAWPGTARKTLQQWGTYGPPIPTGEIVANYKRIRKADPTRPVLLNLGQGVAYDGYNGRGIRSGKLEDYPEYMKGCDLVSFDIYPVVHNKPEVKGKLEFVPRGVDRLREWGKGEKVVWNCIECTHIGNPPALPTVSEIRTEVWMSLIHGSQGLIYFVHEFAPKFVEAGVFGHPEIAKGVGEINAQIHELAPVLNSRTVGGGAAVASSNADVPVDILVKQHGGATYLFAVAMRNADTKAAFQVKGLRGKARAEVLGEGRTIDVENGKFEDDFKGYAVHLYKIAAEK